MFVPYSSDHCIEHRPWLAYITFPAIVIAAFILTLDGPVPEARTMLFVNLLDVSGLVVLGYMLGTFFVLWTFGRAVCAKIGNFLYVVSIGLSSAAGLTLVIAWGEDTLWILNWVVQCLAGMFLVFCPLNSVDCFIFSPPFRSFSMNGLWIIIAWLIADLIFCLILGWSIAVFLHPVSFVSGILLASLFSIVPYVRRELGDLTLWQWIRGETSDETIAWKDSWSVKRQEEIRQQQQEDQRDNSLKQKEEAFIIHHDVNGAEETIRVLCQCGHVVRISKQFQGKSIKCDACNHQIALP